MNNASTDLMPENPVLFVDRLVERHKAWLKKRTRLGESVRYMREAVDVQGRGADFLKHLVHNPSPQVTDVEDENCDLALLEIYELWRTKYTIRPIEPWDGTRLRPWLPPESNPKVPTVLSGDLSHFEDAYVRWGAQKEWDPLDAFGNAVEQYFSSIRRHSIWSRPKSGGKLRLYRHNELNNFETAPYSIRFWGFLKWVDESRRRLLGETVEPYPHDKWSDIAFMDEFNEKHFPWHDDVFGNGKCPKWHGQFGLKARHKYNMNTFGFGLEFLEFHSDLLSHYNDWLARWDRMETLEWRTDYEPWEPGIHDSAYILKSANFAPWSLGGTNGKSLNYREVSPALFEESLPRFKSAALLGAYLEKFQPPQFIGVHGSGHLEHCDIRDPYTNNYSIRFFHWHQWIDMMFKAIIADGRPHHDSKGGSVSLSDPVDKSFFDQFESAQVMNWPLDGVWTYRSYINEPDMEEDERWFEAKLTLSQASLDGVKGQLEPANPKYAYEVNGYIDARNVVFESEPDWWEQREVIVLKAEGCTPATKGHVYEYRGHLVPAWPEGERQVPAIVGSLIRQRRPDDPSLEGFVGSFIAVKHQDQKPLDSFIRPETEEPAKAVREDNSNSEQF